MTAEEAAREAVRRWGPRAWVSPPNDITHGWAYLVGHGDPLDDDGGHLEGVGVDWEDAFRDADARGCCRVRVVGRAPVPEAAGQMSLFGGAA